MAAGLGSGDLQRVPLVDLRPGQASVRFIVLGHRRYAPPEGHRAPDGSAQLWVADETASATLVLRGRSAPSPSFLEPGEIFWLRGGTAALDRSGRLQLTLGSTGKLERAGFLTLAAQDEPDLSAVPYRPRPARASAGAAPAGPASGAPVAAAAGARCAEEASCAAAMRWAAAQGPASHAAASRWAAAQNPASHAAASRWVPPEEENGQGAVPKAGGRAQCLLCGDSSHQLSECGDRGRGVAVRSEALVKAHRGSPRVLLFQKALREFQLPPAEACKWYEKGNTRVLYCRFADERSARQLLDAADFRIGDKSVKCHSLLDGQRRRGGDRDGASVTMGQQLRKAAAKRQAALTKSTPDGGESGSRLRCFLCGSSEHRGSGCPHWRQSVRIVGAAESQKAELCDLLKCHKMSVESCRWNNDQCYVRLGSARQLRKLCGVSQKGALNMAGVVVRAYPFQGSASAERAPPAAPAEAPARAPESACWMCAAVQHRPARCPERAHWVRVLGELDKQVVEKMLSLAAPQASIKRFYFEKDKCFVRLDSKEGAEQVVQSARKDGGLSRGDAAAQADRRVGVFPAFRLAEGTTEANAKVPPQPAPPLPPAPAPGGADGEPCSQATARRPAKRARESATASRKVCFLCGEPDHELPACPVRARCVLVCRELGLVPERSARIPPRLSEALTAALEDFGVTVKRMSWHKTVCYVQLAAEAEARRLLDACRARGVQVSGETLRIREAKSTRQAAPSAAGVEAAQAEAEADEAEAAAAGAGGGGGSGCPLCGGQDHDLSRCADRDQAVVIRSSALEAAEPPLEAAVRAAQDSGCGAPRRVRLHRGSRGAGLYLTLASVEAVGCLLAHAAGEGLEICGVPASVERAGGRDVRPAAGSAGAGAPAGGAARVPGLRPDVRAPKRLRRAG